MRHVAFLRAINVGGHRVTGDRLVGVFRSLGFDEVASFLASGNVVFDADDVSATDLAGFIEPALEDALGYGVRCFVRTGPEVRAIAGTEPFPPTAVDASAGSLQVALLSAAPPGEAVAAVAAMAPADEHVAVIGRELYWLPTTGIMASPLEVPAVERVVGPLTMRTMNTIARLSARFLT